MNSTLAKYSAALIQIVIALAGALAVLKGSITLASALTLVPLVANVLVVHLVPLFGPAMRSGWKTGAATAVALAAAGYPFALAHHITGPQAIVVLLAGLQALGAHIGVQIRNDATTPTTPVAGGAPVAPAATAGVDNDDLLSTSIISVPTVTTMDGTETGTGR